MVVLSTKYHNLYQHNTGALFSVIMRYHLFERTLVRSFVAWLRLLNFARVCVCAGGGGEGGGAIV